LFAGIFSDFCKLENLMNSLRSLWILLALFFHGTSYGQIIEVDICIYGGTSAGVIAAYTANKLGKTTILIEPGKRLGGLSSGGLGFTDIGNKYAISGLARDFYRRIGKHYGKFEQWTFEPKVAEAIFQEYVRRGNVNVVYEKQLKEVKKEGTRITNIILEDAGQTGGSVTVKAKIFIDCTYEGDLMAKAGISYIVGREGNRDYNETINGVQLMDGHQFPDGIDPYHEPGNPSSGLVWGVSAETLAANGTGDKKLQAYNYRICLTNNPANKIEITRPEDYDSTRYELALRLIAASPDKRKLNDYFIWSVMPNQKTDINNRGGFSTDMIGMNYDYPEADYGRRKEIIRAHEVYTKGLLYFYGHDPRVPQELRTEMLQWGYPKDEYTNYGNWSPQVYVREARRMVGQYVMTQANCEGREVVSDGVGLAAYTMDSHNCQRVVVNGQVKNEGNVEVGGFGPYPISYRAIIPKATECINLYVPVCLSATHIAYGSIRMEPVFMVLAQSAAVAAAQAIENRSNVQQVDVTKLQASLKSNPLADKSAFDILIDDADTNSIRQSGSWKTETKGGYGPSYLVAEANASVTFTTRIKTSGTYACYLYVPKITGSTSWATVHIQAGVKKHSTQINITGLVIEGQTSGEWIHLGKYELKSGSETEVTITTDSADGKVVADAVIWTPAR
jgi:hypothetical protein